MMDENLLLRAREGDPEAFAALCEPHRGRVWRTVSSVVRRRVDAEDLAQDTIIKAYQSLKTYRGEAPFGAWLTRIALNTAHDHHKSAWLRKVFFWKDERPDEPDGAAPLDEQAQRSERQRRVRGAVAQLGEKERGPIHLVYFEEYSIAEVARLEGVPESTIRSRIKTGLKKLAGALTDLETDTAPPLPSGEGA